MNKTLLIARSEFVRRVRTRAFLLSVLLAPLGFAALVALPVLVATLNPDDASREIAVLDPSGQLFADVQAQLPERFTATRVHVPLDTLRARVLAERIDVALVLPPGLLRGEDAATLYARSGGGLSQFDAVQGAVRGAVRDVRLRAMGVPDPVRAIVEQPAALRSVTVTEDGDAAGGAALASLVGYLSGMLIYLFVLLYGAMVMRGVIEEKQNRIVEVMASSVRPTEMMLGKVLGIGAVGLAQILLWVALGRAVYAALGDAAAAPSVLPVSLGDLAAQLPPSLLAILLACFLGGYGFYAALYAMVGSAVESESDAQSLSLPVTLPALLPMLLLMPMLDQPDSTLAVVGSLLPPFSTVLLPVRVAVTEVPAWQVAVSLGGLAVAFAGAIWAAARVYRVGILMTGKKATLADLWRWFRTA